jgi:hypothetical protein
MVGCYDVMRHKTGGRSMPRDASEYYTYLLRLWRTGPQGAWRASLQDAQTEERIGFASLLEVFDYLRAQTHGPMETHGGLDLPDDSTRVRPRTNGTHLSRAKESDDGQESRKIDA